MTPRTILPGDHAVRPAMHQQVAVWLAEHGAWFEDTSRIIIGDRYVAITHHLTRAGRYYIEGGDIAACTHTLPISRPFPHQPITEDTTA